MAVTWIINALYLFEFMDFSFLLQKSPQPCLPMVGRGMMITMNMEWVWKQASSHRGFVVHSLLYILIIFFPKGRKEDETGENWIEKERERAQKERERQEKGKKAQMFKPLAHLYHFTLHTL